MEINKMEIIEVDQDNLNLDQPQTTLSRGTQALHSMVSSLLPFRLDRVYLLMPILHPSKMQGIGADKTESLIQAMALNSWPPGGISTTLEQDLKLTCHSEQSKMASTGFGKKVLVKPLQTLVPGILLMTQLLSRSSRLALNYLKTATLRALEVIVSHLLERPALAETPVDLIPEAPNLVVEVTHQEVLDPQMHQHCSILN
ncbi:orf8b [Betacoronavirus Erinaceus/VMC/DEU/2012]|uniref:Orf8b n=1 Tax=Betacoronavirus Erinaceus/VMC/DEU/2012 TaxID=1385427 RepID=U5LNP4_9BETC|nr:orf8b [Betacoronavirus Erinaceus/VMC/DEU/2012]